MVLWVTLPTTDLRDFFYFGPSHSPLSFKITYDGSPSSPPRLSQVLYPNAFPQSLTPPAPAAFQNNLFRSCCSSAQASSPAAISPPVFISVPWWGFTRSPCTHIGGLAHSPLPMSPLASCFSPQWMLRTGISPFSVPRAQPGEDERIDG